MRSSRSRRRIWASNSVTRQLRGKTMNDCPSLMRSLLAILVLTFVPCGGLPLFARSDAPHPGHTLMNGGMEEANGEGGPAGWKFVGKGGGVVQRASNNSFAGAASARIDSTGVAGPE